MCRFFAVPLLVGWLCIVAAAQTRESPAGRGGFGPSAAGRGSATGPAARSSRPPSAESLSESPGALLGLEVVIAEFNLADVTGELTPEKLKELERQGGLRSLIRVHLAALENQTASVQLGQRIPLATGRTSFPRGPSREGPSFATNYTTENFGTTVRGVGRIHDGAILMDITVETSRPAPDAGKPSAESESEIVPPRTVSLNTQSTLRLEPAKELLVEGVQTISPDESMRQVLLVTARVIAPAPVRSDTAPVSSAAPATTPTSETRIFALRNLDSSTAANTIQAIFGDGLLRVAAVRDNDVNSLLVRGNPEHLAEIEAVLLRLDVGKAGQAARE